MPQPYFLINSFRFNLSLSGSANGNGGNIHFGILRLFPRVFTSSFRAFRRLFLRSARFGSTRSAPGVIVDSLTQVTEPFWSSTYASALIS